MNLTSAFQLHSYPRRRFISIQINGTPVQLQLDTASDVTIISQQLWQNLGSPPILPTNQPVTSACGGSIQLIGELKCCVSFRGKSATCTGYIAKSNLNLLGLDWIENLQLADFPISTLCNQVQCSSTSPIRSTHIIRRYPDQFKEDLGTCKLTQAAKLPAQAEPVPWPPPEKPWSRIHIDLAGPINGVTYLVSVDAYSKWPEIVPLSPATSSTTVSALTNMFSQHGVPETIVSDNGTQFTSSYFARFCELNAIEHVRTPVYHPQSNGQVERFVDTFKRALLKSRGEGTTDDTIQRFLFVYRTTPHDSLEHNQTPAELLMGRKLRTMNHAMLPRPTTVPVTRPIKTRFTVGSDVYTRDCRGRRNSWMEGKILRRRGAVMFDIKVGDDIWKRHINQLRPRQAEAMPQAMNPTNLPMDILLDTFQLPPTASLHSVPNPIPDPVLQPRRWTSRKRKPVVPMQVDPKRLRY